MKFLKNLKIVLLVCAFLTGGLNAHNFFTASNDLTGLTKEELQVQSKIIAAQILAELNPDSISKIKKHVIYGACALISGLCAGVITWSYTSAPFSDLDDGGVNACIFGSGVLTFLWSLVLLEILDSVVFDSVRSKEDKLWLLEKLNQVLDNRSK
ncbi:MAG: hypothetical protein V1646_01945 [bacterium]